MSAARPTGTAPQARLPRRLALAPRHAVLVRGDRDRQVGTAPDRARVLEGLSPGLVAMVDRLAAGPCPVPALLDLGGRCGTAGALLGTLLAAGLLVDPDAALRGRRARSSSLVEVRGGGPLAVAVALGLARAGVGGVHARIGGRVGDADVGAGLRPADAGRARTAAVRDRIAAERPGAGTGSPGRVPPDLLVLAGDAGRAPGPGEIVEHLAVTLRDGGGVVGPLVLPGRAPCLDCVALVCAGRDPVWPLVAAQTAGEPSAEPHVVAATAALAVGQALAALEGPARGDPPPPSLGASLELDPQVATITVRGWTAHPSCRCGAARAPGAPCTDPVPGWTIEG